MTKNMDRLKEIALYIFFGMLTTLVALVVFEGLQWVFRPLWSRSHLVTNVVSFIAALVFAFIVNKLYVFEQKSWEPQQVRREIVTFASSRMFAFGLEHSLVALLFSQMIWSRVESWFTPLWLRMPYVDLLPGRYGNPEDGYQFIVRWGFIAVLVVVLNYVFAKWVVFRKKEESQ